MGNMATKKFCCSFKTVAAPGIFRNYFAICSDFLYIAEKGVAVHFFIKDEGHIFCFFETLWDALTALQCVVGSKNLTTPILH